MKKELFLISLNIHLTLLLMPVMAYSQTAGRKVKVTFNLYSPAVMPDQSVFICGSSNNLANWNPSGISMVRRSDSAFFHSTEVRSGEQLEYKYTLGSWERENADGNGAPLPNFRVRPFNDTVITDTVYRWKNDNHGKPLPTITGKVVYHRNFGSGKTRNRDIIVWLPAGYNEETGKKYPVLYMHDGQNLFDASTSSFGNEWRIDESTDSLISAGKIRPVIVVAINNTPDRMQEYTPGDKGELYMEFILSELKPFIDNNYNTKRSARSTFTGGSSAGGTISFMLAWFHPEVFSKALCFSPAFKISSIDLIDDVENYNGRKKKIFLYIDNGGKDLEARLQPGIDLMIGALRKIGYSEGRDLATFFDTKAEHNEKAWARRFPNAIMKIAGF